MYATETLESDSSGSHWLPLLANVTLFYPLLPLALLYGEWLLAWCVLRHIPRPMWDDPKFIDGSSWMHPIVALAFLGLIPCLFASPGLNLQYVSDYQMNPPRRIARSVVFLSLWVGLWLLVAFDPGRVIDWWMD